MTLTRKRKKRRRKRRNLVKREEHLPIGALDMVDTTHLAAFMTAGEMQEAVTAEAVVNNHVGRGR